MHHSHLDVGYTHLQHVAMELHKDFINQALTMLDNTADWPEQSKPKWTCEVTYTMFDEWTNVYTNNLDTLINTNP